MQTHNTGRATLGLVLFVAACGGDSRKLCEPSLGAASAAYTDTDVPLPRHLLESPLGTVEFVDRQSAENPVTNAGAQLGRVLFYDPRLSADNSISCSSCHRQELGFSDTLRSSRGIHGRAGARRTMALANARFNYAGRYFWDERAESLEKQVLTPVKDSIEMGMLSEDLRARLDSTSYYPALFAAAFGSTEISDERAANALAQFIRTLVSSQSRFDAVYATGGAPRPELLTAQEREGSQLFVREGCINCHRTAAQIADKATNIGLERITADTGAGHGRFKPASLRNIAIRPPYMHDGRFATLRKVVEFYSTGVQDNPDLDPRLRGEDGRPRRLDLSPAQVAAIVAFLESLTDSAFIRAERFSNPFACDRTQ